MGFLGEGMSFILATWGMAFVITILVIIRFYYWGIPMEIREAKACKKNILKTIKDHKNHNGIGPLVDKINTLVKVELPLLIKRRDSLRIAKKDALKAINKQAQGKDERSKHLLESLTKSFDKLEKRLQSVETKISAIAAFLELFTIQVGLIADSVMSQGNEDAGSLLDEVLKEFDGMLLAEDEVSKFMASDEQEFLDANIESASEQTVEKQEPIKVI